MSYDVETQQKALEDHESTPNYNRWIFSQIKPYLGKRILEIGSGTGIYSEYALQNAEKLSMIEIEKPFLDSLKNRFDSDARCQIFDLDASSDTMPERLGIEKFDTVISVNVLEHIEDHEKVLQNAYQCLEQNGRIVLYLPAMDMLFSNWDKKIGHFRRYSKRKTKTILEANGFTPLTIRYTNFVGFWGWLLNAKILGKTPKSNDIRGQFKLYDKFFVPMQSVTEKILPLPFGLSLLAVASKK